MSETPALAPSLALYCSALQGLSVHLLDEINHETHLHEEVDEHVPRGACAGIVQAGSTQPGRYR